MHDLRFVVESDTAQIDHLIINRMGLVYLIETKSYSGNLQINDYGEFTVDYDGERFGIPSPIEQSKRHERILMKLMQRLGLGGRIGELEYNHVVLLHPKATIKRPDSKLFDSSMVIKADQFPSWHDSFIQETIGLGALLKGMVNMRSLDTIKEWGEKLMRHHRPADLTSLPDFMKTAVEQKPERRSAKEPSVQTNSGPAPTVLTTTPASEIGTMHPLAKKLVCVTCGTKISFAAGKFCWNNSKRFSGLQYCRVHQTDKTID